MGYLENMENYRDLLSMLDISPILTSNYLLLSAFRKK